jgi:hypothetical protein
MPVQARYGIQVSPSKSSRYCATKWSFQTLLWGLFEPVKHSFIDLAAHNNANQAAVALLNHASQLAGKVAFGLGPAADNIG